MKEQILQLKPYKPGKSPEDIKQEYNINQVIKLASNENPYGCSPEVENAIRGALRNSAIYPDGHASNIREKLAMHLGVNENQLLFGSGLDEVIQIISRTLLVEGDNIVTSEETFPQYKHHAVIEGCEVRETPLKSGCFDLERMYQQIDERTKIVWICNPNNPTGTYVNETALLDFLNKVPSGTYVVIDEAYYEYATAGDYPETIPLLPQFENLIILRTFSKAYGLAAFRIGYAIGHEQIIEKLNICRLPFNTSSFAQLAAVYALEDQQFVKNCVEKTRKEIEKFEEKLSALNVNYYPSQTNFMFIRTEDPTGMYEYLLKNGYIVRPFPNGVRITLGTGSQNEELLSVLEDYFHDRKNTL